MIKEIKIKEILRWRIMETNKEMRNIIRIGDKKSEEFWTVRGLKQREMSFKPNVIQHICVGFDRRNGEGADKRCCNRQRKIIDYYVRR